MTQGFILMISDKSIAHEWEHQVNLLSKWQMMVPAMKSQAHLHSVVDRQSGMKDPISLM